MASKVSYTYGDLATSDIKLIINNGKALFLHSSIIKQYPPFKELLSNFSFPPPKGCKHHIPTKFNGIWYGLDDYIEFIKLMYCSDEEITKCKFESVGKALLALRFASNYSFMKLADRCISFLSCVRWSQGEEEEIRWCIAHIEIIPSEELTDRLSHSVTAETVEGFFFHHLMITSPLSPILTRELIEECLDKGGEFHEIMEKCMKECAVMEVCKLEIDSSYSGEFLSWLALKAKESGWLDVIAVLLRNVSSNPSIIARVALDEEWWTLIQIMLRGLKDGEFNYSAPMRVALLKSSVMLMADDKGDSGRWKKMKGLWFEVANGLPLFSQDDLFKTVDQEGLVWEEIKEWWHKCLIRELRRLPKP